MSFRHCLNLKLSEFCKVLPLHCKELTPVARMGMPLKNAGSIKIAAGNSRCPCQLQLIYEFVRHNFVSTPRSAALPELWTSDPMTPPFTCSRRLEMAVALLIILVACGAVLIFAPNCKSAPSVRVLDPRLRILLVQMQKGSGTYYLPKRRSVLGSAGQGLGSSVEGKLRDNIRSFGVNVELMHSFRPGTGPGGRAFLVGYAFPDPPNSSVHLNAELVAESGAVYPLQSKAGGGEGPPEKSWNLYTLGSLPSGVSNYVLRLKLGTNGLPLAEIRFPEP
jgi:hypothetical protein